MRKGSILLLFLIMVFTFNGFAKIRNPFKRPSIIMITMHDRNKRPKSDNVQDLLNSLVLSGILNNKIAVINHQFYRVGDSIKIFKVEEVGENKVVLKANGKEYELILNIDKDVKEVTRDKKTLNKEHYKWKN